MQVALSSTATSSASVELFTLIFCLDEIEIILPFPNVNVALACDLISGQTARDASMFQVRTPLSIASRTDGECVYCFVQDSILVNFLESSSDKSFSLVHRNHIVSSMSGLALFTTNKRRTIILCTNSLISLFILGKSAFALNIFPLHGY